MGKERAVSACQEGILKGWRMAVGIAWYKGLLKECVGVTYWLTGYRGDTCLVKPWRTLWARRGKQKEGWLVLSLHLSKHHTSERGLSN